MTDLEMTQLCAEAMGFKQIIVERGQVYVVLVTEQGPKAYFPLFDDAQAFRLLMNFPTPCITALQLSRLTDESPSSDFRRALVEAVAIVRAKEVRRFTHMSDDELRAAAERYAKPETGWKKMTRRQLINLMVEVFP